MLEKQQIFLRYLTFFKVFNAKKMIHRAFHSEPRDLSNVTTRKL